MFNKLANGIDALNNTLGKTISWLMLLMAAVMFIVVILRYVFSIGWVWMQETVVFMHGFIFMLAAGYTLLSEEHVRIDIIYRPLNDRKKAVVNIIGTLLLLFPTCFVIFYYSFPYVMDSWSILEPSRETGGLPGVFILKTSLLIFPVLLGLQGLSKIIRAVQTLQAGK